MGKNGITSAHDRIAFRHALIAADAAPDSRPRGIGLDTWIAADGTRLALNSYHRDALPGHFVATGVGWRVEKHYTLHDDALEIAYRVTGEATMTSRLETQLNLALPSCDGYGGRYVLADGSIPCGFGQPLDLIDASQLTLEDTELHGALNIAVSPASPAGAAKPIPLRRNTLGVPTFTARPHHTVSQSEAGFEKIMQAVCITLIRPAPTSGWQRITLKVVAAS